MTVPNMFTVVLERRECKRAAQEKPDMVEAIADKLLEDHMALMAECEALRKERDELLRLWFDDADPAETAYAKQYALAKVGGSNTATP